MKTIGYVSNFTNGFSIEIGPNPNIVNGNRFLVNLFEVLLLSSIQSFVYDGTIVEVTNVGDLENMVCDDNIAFNKEALTMSVINAINRTVLSLKASENEKTPNTERIKSASLTDITTNEDRLSVSIKILPVEVEKGFNPTYNLPII